MSDNRKLPLLRAILRWTWKSLLLLLAILVIFILEENIRGLIMLARYEAELRAKGEKLTLAEIDLPKPSSETNGASALLAAADEIVAVSKANPQAQYGLDTVMTKFVAPGHAVVLHWQDRLLDRRPPPPLPHIPSGGRRPRRGEVEEQPYIPQPLPTCSWDELSKDIAAVSNALDKARSAARQSTHAVELDYAKDFGPQLRYLEKTSHLRPWLSVATLDALHRGNLEDALEDIATIAGLTRLQKDERLLWIQQLRIGAAGAGLRLTWEALQADGWTDARLARLQECWQKAECLPDFVPSVAMGRSLWLQSYSPDRLKKLLDYRGYSGDPEYRRMDWADVCAYILSRLGFESFSANGLQQRVEYNLDDRWHTTLQRMYFFIWRMAWFEQNETFALHEWQESLDGARAVSNQKSWAAWPAKPERRWMFYDRWRRSGYGTGYGGNNLMQEAAQYETLREMTIAAIALKRFQLRTGTFPASLSALVPDVLPELPHDWMDGKPLRYRLNANGTFTLYSVGDNGRDDGGNPTPSGLISSMGEMWRGLDAVWSTPATREEIEAWETKRQQRMRQGIESKR
ncbi:MAG TPA: hypothetical protein VLZ30_10090 [Verrucomicrobiae bacterium]|nr:hypothetical protein [Verrucomicrobiae bacterium]